MPSNFEVPSFEALVREQTTVQADKFQGRLLEEYSQHIFPGQDWRTPRSSAVTDFLRPHCLGDRVSLGGVIKGLCQTRKSDQIHWVDMGGGRALPMRQLASDSTISGQVAMTNVDLFDFGLNGLEPQDVTALERLDPKIFEESVTPNFIHADAERVDLPEPADLITSVESIQYLNNPLVAISNWYNQLAINGLLIVSTDHDWPSWIRYDRSQQTGGHKETPTKHLLGVLGAAGIPFAASYECDWGHGYRPPLDPNCFRNLVIVKSPGTELAVKSTLTEVWVSPHDFKAAYYEKSGDRDIVEVIAA